SCSPGRAARDVYDRDMHKFGIFFTSCSTSVVFPVPEGADTINSRPRFASCAGARGLFDILDLLTHLLELRLRVDDQLRHAQAVGLRSDRVHLAVHLLQQEIELASARFGAL